MATTSTPSSPAGAVSPKKAGMPRRQVAAAPLDYSFMGLSSLSEMQQHDPVSGSKKYVSVGSLTTRSSGGSGDDLTAPTSDAPARLDRQGARTGAGTTAKKRQWLDLSGNEVTSIPPEVFSAYPDLFTLHLHGNLLSKYADIDALAKWLPRLHSITLHGNPLEEKKHYRNYVIAALPNLKQLNFSCVTPGDRVKAETWASIYKNARSGGKGRRDEEL